MNRKPRRTAAVNATLLQAINAFCPLRWAADWDNVGLLAGDEQWPVRHALLAIDLTDAVAREALQRRASALVVYHPPIFKGVKNIGTRSEAPTSLLAELLAARTSVFSVHTAWDAAEGGTNDALLDWFAITARRPLEPIVTSGRQYKLVVFTPAAEAERLRAALALAGAGRIGAYDECSFSVSGRGSFRGAASTNPTIGRRQQLELVDELRLEMVLPAHALAAVVQALYATHSYEEPAFDLYPLHTVEGRARVGLGRFGALSKPQSGTRLLSALRRNVDLSTATIIGALDRHFTAIVAAAGSFGVRSLSAHPEALVLTGELKHHDALQLEKAGVTAVCLGHDRSERPGLARLRSRLAAALPGVKFELARTDRSPTRTAR